MITTSNKSVVSSCFLPSTCFSKSLFAVVSFLFGLWLAKGGSSTSSSSSNSNSNHHTDGGPGSLFLRGEMLPDMPKVVTTTTHHVATNEHGSATTVVTTTTTTTTTIKDNSAAPPPPPPTGSSSSSNDHQNNGAATVVAPPPPAQQQQQQQPAPQQPPPVASLDEEKKKEKPQPLPVPVRQQPYRFCNGLNLIKATGGTQDGFYLRYRCEGPEYDKFATVLHDYVEKEASHHHLYWGKRGIPANQTYLILGSSHLQQVAQSLVCQEHQYGSGLVNVESLDLAVHPLVMVRYTFGNGAVVYHGANDWVIHMKQWPMYLANQTGVPLTAFDRVIVGTTNSCSPPVRTTFAEDMKKLLASRFGVDCENPEGPEFHVYAKEFQQPLLYVNMFALYSAHRQAEDRAEFFAVRNSHDPQTLYYEDARKYIDRMGKGVWECGSVSMKVRYDCVNNSTATEKLHRCQGARGAHPDLVAWDVVEFMHGDYLDMQRGGPQHHHRYYW